MHDTKAVQVCSSYFHLECRYKFLLFLISPFLSASTAHTYSLIPSVLSSLLLSHPRISHPGICPTQQEENLSHAEKQAGLNYPPACAKLSSGLAHTNEPWSEQSGAGTGPRINCSLHTALGTQPEAKCLDASWIKPLKSGENSFLCWLPEPCDIL